MSETLKIEFLHNFFNNDKFNILIIFIIGTHE